MLVIIPNYNKSFFIKKNLDSLREQTYTDYQTIVFDDGSTDSSREIVAQEKVSLMAYPKMGIAKILNQAFSSAKNMNHEFAVILASDDVVHKDWIKEMVELQKKTKADFVTTAGRRFGTAKEPFTECSTGLYRVSMWAELGGRDETLKHVSDTEMKMRMYKKGYKKRVVKKELYYWRSYSWQDSRLAGDTTSLVNSLAKKHKLTPKEQKIALTEPFN